MRYVRNTIIVIWGIIGALIVWGLVAPAYPYRWFRKDVPR